MQVYTKYLINEGWLPSKNKKSFSAWASDIDAFMKSKGRNIKCPKCSKELSRKEIFSNPKRDGEEIASFENICSCGAKLIVFND